MSPDDEARILRGRQAALDQRIDANRRDDDQGSPACIITPVRLPGDAWPPNLGFAPGGTLYHVSAVSVSGPMAPGSTLTATVSPATFTAIKMGTGTPPDPTVSTDPTTWLYALATQAGGRWYFEYWT